jgi:uncharacterized protein (TIGR02271 family)
MVSENVIATFDNEAEAQHAIAKLESIGIPSHAIEIHSKNTGFSSERTTEYTTTAEPKKGSFWSWLTGDEQTESTDDHQHYDREIEAGSVVVSVITNQDDVEKVTEILRSHNTSVTVEALTPASSASLAASQATTEPAEHQSSIITSEPTALRDENSTPVDEEVIPLHEEKLVVGKTEVEAGRIRVRRFTTQRPVEAQVALRQEHITVHRRPVTSSNEHDPSAFENKAVEFTATSEEAVVGKTASVVEEVVVSKHSHQHEETVSDTVRKEEVDVDDADLKPTVTR